MACTVACNTFYNLPLGKFKLSVNNFDKGKYPDSKKIALPIMCFQCEKPKCITACKSTGVNAIYKRIEDGIVIIDSDKCQGKQKCISDGCPYSNIYFNPLTGKAEKCSLCIDAMWDKEEMPVCVSTCNGKALIYGDINNPSSDAGQAVRNYFNEGGKPMKLKNTIDGTRPSTVYLGIEEWIKIIDKNLTGYKELNPHKIFEVLPE